MIGLGALSAQTRWGDGALALDAWNVTHAGPAEAEALASAGWNAERLTAELIYDTAEQGLPRGVRAVLQDGNRRLLFELDEYEVLVQVTPDPATGRRGVIGQVLFEGLPVAGSPVRAGWDGGSASATTGPTGQFHLAASFGGALRLEVLVQGGVLEVPPIALR